MNDESEKRVRSVNKLSIAVVVPVHDAKGTIQECLKSVNQCDPAADEIIVIVDGKTDDSLETHELENINVITLDEPCGPAKARNSGARTANSSILFFIDSDVSIPPNSIARVRDFFVDNPETDALIGSYDDQPSESNFLSQYKNLFQHYVHQIANENASTFWGACGAIRRNVFLEMNGFDECYKRPCIEDIELGYRLRKSGYTIHLLKDLQHVSG